MKRVIRKHSMELKKKENKFNEVNLEYTKKYSQRKDLVELPPLFLKKGVTTPF